MNSLVYCTYVVPFVKENLTDPEEINILLTHTRISNPILMGVQQKLGKLEIEDAIKISGGKPKTSNIISLTAKLIVNSRG